MILLNAYSKNNYNDKNAKKHKHKTMQIDCNIYKYDDTILSGNPLVCAHTHTYIYNIHLYVHYLTKTIELTGKCGVNLIFITTLVPNSVAMQDYQQQHCWLQN